MASGNVYLHSSAHWNTRSSFINCMSRNLDLQDATSGTLYWKWVLPSFPAICLYLPKAIKKPGGDKNDHLDLARCLSRSEHHPTHQKVVGLIPHQSIYLGCLSNLCMGGNRSMFLFLYHSVSSLSPVPPSLKSIKTYSWVGMEKKKKRNGLSAFQLEDIHFLNLHLKTFFYWF